MLGNMYHLSSKCIESERVHTTNSRWTDITKKHVGQGVIMDFKHALLVTKQRHEEVAKMIDWKVCRCPHPTEWSE